MKIRTSGIIVITREVLASKALRSLSRVALLVYLDSVGTTKDQAIKMVRECESTDCPLYNFRTGFETTPGLSKKFSREQKDSMQKRAKSLRKRKWT